MRTLLLLPFAGALLAGCPTPADDAGKDDDTGDTHDTGDTADDTDDTDTADTYDTGDTDIGPPASLPDDFPASLALDGGCGDIYLYAHDEADTVMVDFEAWELGVALAACTDGPQSLELTLPMDGVRLQATVGEHVSAYSCADAIEEEPVVARTWSATAGTVHLDVTSTEDATCEEWNLGAMATLTLENVTFTPDDGGEGAVTLPTATYEAYVGWMPG